MIPPGFGNLVGSLGYYLVWVIAKKNTEFTGRRKVSVIIFVFGQGPIDVVYSRKFLACLGKSRVRLSSQNSSFLQNSRNPFLI